MSGFRLVCLLCVFSAVSQAAEITPEQVKSVIQDYRRTLVNEYIFPAKARAIAAEMDKLDVSDIRTRRELAARITELVGGYDKHLALVTRVDGKGNPTKEAKEPWFAQLKRKNSGIRKVEVLAGNIGYIEMWGFDKPTAASRKALEAAMSLVEQVDALILDFRKHGGGDSFMLSEFSSYFLPAGTPLHTYKFRHNGSFNFVTRDTRGSDRFRSMPLYVLISRDTFSGGESFAYLAKHLKRATVVGEVSKGGANPVNTYRISHDFEAWVSVGSTVNAVTGKNWEHVGVLPQLKTSAEGALNTAYIRALQYQEKRSKNNRFLLAEIQAQLALIAAPSDVKTP